MQYWFCEYQAEDDAFNSVKKLHGNIHTLEINLDNIVEPPNYHTTITIFPPIFSFHPVSPD